MPIKNPEYSHVQGRPARARQSRGHAGGRSAFSRRCHRRDWQHRPPNLHQSVHLSRPSDLFLQRRQRSRSPRRPYPPSITPPSIVPVMRSVSPSSSVAFASCFRRGGACPARRAQREFLLRRAMLPVHPDAGVATLTLPIAHIRYDCATMALEGEAQCSIDSFFTTTNSCPSKNAACLPARPVCSTAGACSPLCIFLMVSLSPSSAIGSASNATPRERTVLFPSTPKRSAAICSKSSAPITFPKAAPAFTRFTIKSATGAATKVFRSLTCFCAAPICLLFASPPASIFANTGATPPRRSPA